MSTVDIMQSPFDNVSPELFVPPKPLWLKVLDFLRDAIVKGEIKPGEKLNEALIASKLGISRSPVREAIRVLESENFVETIAHRGPFVKPLTVKEIEEIHVVLKFLQGAAIHLAINNMSDERKEELTSIMKQLEKGKETKDIEELKSVSRRFHAFIMKTSENNLLIRINEALFIQQERVRLWGASTEPEDVEAIYEEHLFISKALLNQDAKEAERLMIDHVEKARARFLKAVTKGGDCLREFSDKK
ncbi:MAG: FCD domain-containing protein [Proteobacteria bacterium]|nr:FCD domain-containing protein [Pseudomonadota bacterium]